MIRRIESGDIGKVAVMHRVELSGFLPELGQKFLEMFYKSSLKVPEMFTFVDCEGGKVTGFVSGVTAARELNKRIIFEQPVQFGFILLKYLITHPYSAGKFIKILSYPGFKEPGAELLTLAVDKDRRLRGIGRKLFERIVAEFKKRGINKFKISAYARLDANKFYEKMDCRLLSSFDFLGEKMNYFEYKITP